MKLLVQCCRDYEVLGYTHTSTLVVIVMLVRNIPADGVRSRRPPDSGPLKVPHGIPVTERNIYNSLIRLRLAATGGIGVDAAWVLVVSSVPTDIQYL